MLSKAAFIQPKYSKSNNFVKIQFKIVVFCVRFNNVTLICDAKLNFQHNHSSLQCHMITQISFEYREYIFFLLLMLKTLVAFLCEKYYLLQYTDNCL